MHRKNRTSSPSLLLWGLAGAVLSAALLGFLPTQQPCILLIELSAALVGGGLFALGYVRQMPAAGLAGGVAAFALFGTSLSARHMLERSLLLDPIWPVWAIAGPVAAVIFLFALDWWIKRRREEPDQRRKDTGILMTLLLLVFWVSTCVDLVLCADILLDPSAPEVRRGVVVQTGQERHFTGKGGGYTTYYIRLEPGGPLAPGDRLPVERSEYLALKSGDSVEVLVHDGLFGLAWAELGR